MGWTAAARWRTIVSVQGRVGCRHVHLNGISTLRECNVYRYGNELIPYEKAWKWQQEFMKEHWKETRSDVSKDVVMLLQHKSVYTLGRGASMDNVKQKLKDDNIETTSSLIRVDRGGEVTYHGPGQLVVYPILNLRYHTKDLHWYLRQVEQVVIETLASFQVLGERIPGLTGVWVDGKKIAAVGTHASKWVTMHGFALNVQVDLRAFDEIVPCGIEDRQVMNLQQIRPDVSIEQVEEAALEAFKTVFSLKLCTNTMLDRCYDNGLDGC